MATRAKKAYMLASYSGSKLYYNEQAGSFPTLAKALDAALDRRTPNGIIVEIKDVIKYGTVIGVTETRLSAINGKPLP